MATQNQNRVEFKVPAITLCVVGFSVIVWLLPQMQPHLVYNRAAILTGEWWRVFTGHWVHFSAEHFVYDTLAFGIAGWMIERRGYRNFGVLCALSPVVIGVAMWVLAPELVICGGLSGMATAAMIFLALHGLKEQGSWRWICGTLLLFCAAKMSMELITGRFVFLHPAGEFVPVPSNHIAGALVAVGAFGATLRTLRRTAELVECRHANPGHQHRPDARVGKSQLGGGEIGSRSHPARRQMCCPCRARTHASQ